MQLYHVESKDSCITSISSSHCSIMVYVSAERYVIQHLGAGEST